MRPTRRAPVVLFALSLAFAAHLRPAPAQAALSVTTAIDRTTCSWFGWIEVEAFVTEGGSPVTDCDSVVATSPVNPASRAYLVDDGVAPDAIAGDGLYSGIFRIGGDDGESRPTGSYALTASAYRGTEVAGGVSPSFGLFIVRRWTGYTTSDVPDVSDRYANYTVTPTPQGRWHHRIEDLGLVRSIAATNARVSVPVFPLDVPITNVSVTGPGVAGVRTHGNVIEFECDLSAASVARVKVEFDAPGDLAAIHIDRYHTGDIGRRDFRNGYAVWNRYCSTAVMGSDFSTPHGPGCVVDLQVIDPVAGRNHTVDCMERVAVHLDDTAFNDGTGTYPSNVKWTGDAPGWLTQAAPDSMTFLFESGGLYGLRDKVHVTKTVTFYAGRRFFRHHYRVRNIDALSHDMDFVWGREQWLYGSAAGSDRQQDDRGLLPNDGGIYSGEHGFAGSALDGNWFATYDRTSFYTIAVLLPDRAPELMPTYSYFLCQPPLGGGTGEYPIIPSGTCPDQENIFFEKQFGVLAPGDSVDYVFYQWGGFGAERPEVEDLLWRDATYLSGEPLVVDHAPGGTDVALDAPIDVWFSEAMNRAVTESAFLVTPPVTGAWEWSDGDTHARFALTEPLAPETTYEVVVMRSAEDTDGGTLATEASWTFATGSAVTAVATLEDVPELAISGADPNPFLVQTSIRYAVPAAAAVELAIYDVTGRRIAVLASGRREAGPHRARWDGRDDRGRDAAPGVYFARLEAAGGVRTRKLILQR